MDTISAQTKNDGDTERTGNDLRTAEKHYGIGIVVMNTQGQLLTLYKQPMHAAGKQTESYGQFIQGLRPATEKPVRALRRILTEHLTLDVGKVEIVEHGLVTIDSISETVKTSRNKPWNVVERHWYLVGLKPTVPLAAVETRIPAKGRVRWNTPQQVVDSLQDFRAENYRRILDYFADDFQPVLN